MAPTTEFTTMSVSLPKEQKVFIEHRVATGGFGSVSDYVRELVRRDQRDAERSEIEKRLLAALESPTTEMTAQDWQELRDNLIARQRSGGDG